VTADLYRSGRDIAQPAHADLGHGEPRFNATVRLDTGIDHSRATRKPEGPDSQLVRLIGHAVGDVVGGFIHPQ
jgi:hypothetical protein